MANDWTAADFAGQDHGKLKSGAKTGEETAAAAKAPGTPTSPDPFTSMGGGVWNGTGWIPKNHPDAAKYMNTATPTGGVDPAAPVKPATIGSQAAAASTFSNAPGSAPTQNTTNQGTQDVLRNTYLKQVTQGTQIDAQNDPNIRQQSDAFAAAQERARRDQASDIAEKFAGTGQTGAQTVEQRMLNEKAQQGRASFEADLVGRELQTRRDEIKDALGNLGGMLSDDQNRALQLELAKLDAQIKKAGISTSESLGRSELALKDKLGMGGLNVDLARLLTQNGQFNKSLGFQIGDREATLNQQALLSLLR